MFNYKNIIFFACLFLTANVSFSSNQISKNNVIAKKIDFNGNQYDIFILKPPFHNIKIHWLGSGNKPISNFRTLKKYLAKKNKKLVFATNAGIFAHGYKPLGLHIENSKKLVKLNRKKGVGNFYVRPNGVFAITKKGQALIAQSRFFQKKKGSYRLATQSGPLLVFNKKIHWLFKKNAKSKYIRNGVGLDRKGAIIFAISNSPTNLYNFAALFHQKLKCDNALYLDGSISKMYLPALNRLQTRGNFAGMISYSLKNTPNAN